LINLQKSSREPPARRHRFLAWNHPWGKEIQDCSDDVPRVMYGPTPGA